VELGGQLVVPIPELLLPDDEEPPEEVWPKADNPPNITSIAIKNPVATM